MGQLAYGLQLYTVRDHMEKDVAATLKRVKEIGYDNVELAGTCGLARDAFRGLLDDAGLKAVSAHMGFPEVTGDTDACAEQVKTLGPDYVVISFLGGDATPDKDAWIRGAEAMNAAGEKLRAAGLRLCYHNHAHEFEPVEGERPFDIIFDRSQPENLASELDTYWVKYGGEDPLAMVRRFAGRLPLLHVKDMTAEEPHTFAEAGRGVIEWCPIFEAARAGGAEWFLVEQDVCEGDSLASAQISAAFMAAQ